MSDSPGVPSDIGENAEWRDVSISMDRAATLATFLLPAIFVAGLLPHLLIWGWPAVRAGFGTVFTLRYFVPGLLVTIVVHEGLHAAGFLLFGRVHRRAVHFGIDHSTFSPYAGCREPMRADAYRAAVLLPAFVLGVVPLLAGWLTGTGWLAVLGTLQLAAAGGDLVAFWAFREVPGAGRVLDHPNRVGCRVWNG